ncbi:MAG: family 16 glycosylhydrolase [Bradymonadales bacterium]|nr:family 16 glycosylhydrolase [Bradymonadales bacterium]
MFYRQNLHRTGQVTKANRPALGRAVGCPVIAALLALCLSGTGCGTSSEAPCGNGTLDRGEGCDDGNFFDGDGCSQQCQVEPGFSCQSEPSLCQTHCGDGITAGQESCDDGNTYTESCPYGARSCEVCDSSCNRISGETSFCGDLTVDETMNEECDDGNLDPCDGCLPDCKQHTNECGDRLVCDAEACDDGNLDPCDGCLEDCTLHTNECGDGFQCDEETCDDGNTVTESCPYGVTSCWVCDDSCRHTLGPTSYCGDRRVDRMVQEVCDHGSQNSDLPCDDCCRSDCTPQRCGDGVRDFPAGEDCDDGNTDNNDGCDADCTYTGQEVTWEVTRRWRLSWMDEFNGAVPGREACYDEAVTPPQCLTLYWEVTPCPAEAITQLADLDKCTWGVFSLYNWMDNNQPLDEGVNAFDPRQVTVEGGELLLFSDPSPPPGGFPSSWTSSTSIDTILQAYDCGNPPQTGWAYSTVCPILSGGLWSKAIGAVEGFAQTYGRFDIRARLPIGRGSWPAHWLLPQDGPWPGDGEIDIMEATAWNPTTVGANFHDGVEYVDTTGRTVRTHMSSGGMDLEMSQTQQGDEYHVYSVEWDPEVLRFYVDNREIGQVWQGTLARNTDLETGDFVGYFPLDVPDEPFHVILNSTVAAASRSHYPHPMDFPRQTHHIDYVRSWSLCEGPSDSCFWGGAFDGTRCLVGLLPDRDDLAILGSSLVYPVEQTGTPCPEGGQQEGSWCVVYSVDPRANSYMEDGSFYIANACVESTLSPFCPDPCQGIGRYDGYNCYLASAPPMTEGFLSDGIFFYNALPADAENRCPIGHLAGLICEVGPVPEGRTAFVHEDRHFYLTPVCDPTATMPNCAEPCPIVGEYDGDDCYLFDPPVGANPFVYDNGFYYEPLSADPATRCPMGSYDGANCFLGSAPEGTHALVKNGVYYVLPACGHVPRAWFHPS